VSSDPLGALTGAQLCNAKKVAVVRNYVVEDQETLYEPLKDYIIRHTLRRPREMIIIGNQILATRRDWNQPEQDGSEVIRVAVDRAASSVIATGYIAEVQHRWPWQNDPKTSVQEFIRRFLTKNVLSRKEADKIQRAFAKMVDSPPEEVHPFCQLASFGLIGWPVQKLNSRTWVQNFAMPGEDNTRVLPGSAEWYLVHPILYGEPFHITAAKGLIVGHGLAFNDQFNFYSSNYLSCFIAYGQPDEQFAARLNKDLRSEGVYCWLYLSDASVGSRTWQEITEKRRATKKMVVICSGASLIRDGLLKELEDQIHEDPDKIIPISIDNLWKEQGFKVVRGNCDLKPYLMERTFADFTKNYRNAFQKLIKALRREDSGNIK
jgi:hypothetical protein